MGLFDGIGSLLGFGNNNSQFQASNPTNPDQMNQIYSQIQSGLSQQQALAGALQGQGTLGMNSQAALTGMLMNQANGQGPNPAQNMLNQATGQNVANQAALMASQRGAGANAGLIARQAAQQGAGIQQNAAGQAATMGAQQQLAAQQQLQNLAGTQIGQQQGALSNYNQLAQNEQANLFNANANANAVNGQVAQTNSKNSGGVLGGLINGLGGAIAGPLGSIFSSAGPSAAAAPMGSSSSTSQFGGLGANLSYAHGGEVPSHLTHMASIYHPHMMAEGGSVPMMSGGPVPGTPKYDYNTTKNDVVDAKLSPKEIVLPLSVTKAEDAPQKAYDFVKALKEKNGYSDDSDEHGDFKEALKKAISTRKKKVS